MICQGFFLAQYNQRKISLKRSCTESMEYDSPTYNLRQYIVVINTVLNAQLD